MGGRGREDTHLHLSICFPEDTTEAIYSLLELCKILVPAAFIINNKQPRTAEIFGQGWPKNQSNSMVTTSVICRVALSLDDKVKRIVGCCRQDDLWVLSSAASMHLGGGRGKVVDRLNQQWTECARSLWHGPNKDGK